MGYITTTFLGKVYTIPEDVLTYIVLLDFTDNVQKQLVSVFVRKLRNEIQKDNIGLLGDEDLGEEIEQQVGKFVAKLCDNGIFTRTISDYLKNSKGYQLYSDVNKAALEKMKSLLIQKMDAWQAGYEDAVNRAKSHVTGMGFSILSSSFVNHAIYAAMEASTLNKQGKEAEAQYQKDMNDLRSRLDSQYGGEKSNYINNTYIPNMEAALIVFAYELLDKYVADLIANGKFDAKTLSYVDIGRSNDLLKNLTLSNNKKAILENAFTACPYNIAVYMQAMKYDLLDYDSFQTAKVFKQDHHILSFLKENWGEVSFPTKFSINYHCINVWASLMGKSSADLLRGLTEQYATSIVKAYSRITDMLADMRLCQKVIGDCNEAEILAGDAICKTKAHSYVDTVVSSTIWNQLTEKCGHTDLLNRVKNSIPEIGEFSCKEDVDSYLIEKLTACFKETRLLLIPQITERLQLEEQRQIAAAEKQAKEAAAKKKKAKRSIITGVILVIVLIITTLVVKAINATRHFNEQIEIIEINYTSGGYEAALLAIKSSELDETDKASAFNDLVEKTDFAEMNVYGLKSLVPEHWEIRINDDGDIARAHSDGYRSEWYIRYEGEYDDIHAKGDDFWSDNSAYASTNIDFCTNAYVEYDSGIDNKSNRYNSITYYIVCDSSVFLINYFAYEDRYSEREAQFLLSQVDFSGYKYSEEIIADAKEKVLAEKYKAALALMDKKEFEAAISAFKELDDYKDSATQIERCRQLIMDDAYNNALAAIQVGKYEDAYSMLIEIHDYLDVSQLLQNFKWVPAKSTYVPAKSSESNSYHTYTYNDNGILIEEVIDDSTVVTYSYDSHGNIILKKYTYLDGDTSQNEYKYNASNQLVQERYSYPDGSVDVVNYTYDSNGRIFEAEDIHWGSFNERHTYSFDATGKLIKKDTIDHFDSIGCYEYQYDEDGRLIKEIHTTDIGESYSVVYTTEYSYSTYGCLLEVYEYKDDKEIGYEVFDEYIVFYSPEGFYD